MPVCVCVRPRVRDCVCYHVPLLLSHHTLSTPPLSSLTVTNTDYGACSNPLPVTQETGYLYRNTSVTSSKCNSVELRAQPGQRINLTLVDFYWSGDGIRNKPTLVRDQNCLRYGHVRDPDAARNITICGGGERREHNLLLTQNNTAQIFWISHKVDGRFLIKYQGTCHPALDIYAIDDVTEPC